MADNRFILTFSLVLLLVLVLGIWLGNSSLLMKKSNVHEKPPEKTELAPTKKKQIDLGIQRTSVSFNRDKRKKRGSIVSLTEDEKEVLQRVETGIHSQQNLAEKMELLEELQDITHPWTLEIVENALESSDPEIRKTAIDLLHGYASSDILPAIEKAFEDEEDEIREAAIYALDGIEDPKLVDLLGRALEDRSEGVRQASLEITNEKMDSIKYPVLEKGIRSNYHDVKSEVVTLLEEETSHDALDILIEGFRDPNTEFQEDVRDTIYFLISEKFYHYEKAKSWWQENRAKYDHQLFEKE